MQSFAKLVEDEMLLVEGKMRQHFNDCQPDMLFALNRMLSSGGKRIRPHVTLLTGSVMDVEVESLVTLSASVELLHTATLVHDDLIDGSLLRRGAATLNANWSPAATVLTGDFLFAAAARLASETGSLEIMKMFAKTLSIIVNGEVSQLFDSPGNVNREHYLERIYAKTASLFECITGSVGLLCSTDPAFQVKIKKLGYEIGMAFQIVDDILDFTGKQETVGKPVGSDLRQGVITLPAICYFEEHPDDQALQLLKNGEKLNDKAIEKLINEIHRNGCIALALNEAKCYADRGMKIVRDLPNKLERQALEDLCNYVVSRHQ